MILKGKDLALYNLADDPGERINLYNLPEYADMIGYLENPDGEWTNGRNFAPGKN